jgi:hypothetical protein
MDEDEEPHILYESTTLDHMYIKGLHKFLAEECGPEVMCSLQ